MVDLEAPSDGEDDDEIDDVEVTYRPRRSDAVSSTLEQVIALNKLMVERMDKQDKKRKTEKVKAKARRQKKKQGRGQMSQKARENGLAQSRVDEEVARLTARTLTKIRI